MGNEHSRDVPNEASAPPDEVSKDETESGEGTPPLLGRDSPRPSVCSDGDLPYISYTVNRPIGESPKRLKKGVLRSSSTSRRFSKRTLRPQEVVVVREANSGKNNVDPELVRLQKIPMFLPIMRGALTAPSARDPDVLERLDVSSSYSLCRRLQVHFHAAASLVSFHQQKLTSSVKKLDSKVTALVSMITERQRAYARHAERLSQVTEVNHLLTRCHSSLNLTLESLDTLNNSLPLELRLEPFVWTTG